MSASSPEGPGSLIALELGRQGGLFKGRWSLSPEDCPTGFVTQLSDATCLACPVETAVTNGSRLTRPMTCSRAPSLRFAETTRSLSVTCGALEIRRPLSNELQAWHLISGALSQCDPRGSCKRTERHAEHGVHDRGAPPAEGGKRCSPPLVGLCSLSCPARI
jgi:hypothetical protein